MEKQNQIQPSIDNLMENIKQYAEIQFKIYELEAVQKSAVIGSGMVVSIIKGISLLLFIIFGSIAAAYQIISVTHNAALAFACVAAFYLLATLVILFLGSKPIRNKIQNNIIINLTTKDHA